MTGPGRPPIGPVINIRLDPDVLNMVDHYAKTIETTRAEALRYLIDLGLIHHGYPLVATEP